MKQLVHGHRNINYTQVLRTKYTEININFVSILSLTQTFTRYIILLSCRCGFLALFSGYSLVYLRLDKDLTMKFWTLDQEQRKSLPNYGLDLNLLILVLSIIMLAHWFLGKTTLSSFNWGVVSSFWSLSWSEENRFFPCLCDPYILHLAPLKYKCFQSYFS